MTGNGQDVSLRHLLLDHWNYCKLEWANLWLYRFFEFLNSCI